MFLPLIAAPVDGGTTSFSIEDCPKLVDDGLFYLANRPGTSLLRKDTIFRGSDMFALNGERIFEGDMLQADDGIYFVRFYNGFKLRGQDGSPHPPGGQYTRLGHWLELRGRVEMPVWLDRHFAESKHSSMRYMLLSQQIMFCLFDIISAFERNILINRSGGTLASFDDVGQYSGIKHPAGCGYYYGQCLKDFGTVTIQSGEPGILTSAGFKAFGDTEFRMRLENTLLNDITNNSEVTKK